MRTSVALAVNADRLSQAGVCDAGLEAEVLIRHLLRMERAEFFASPDRELGLSQQRRLSALVRRRADSEPLAYITGHREFYGLDFVVGPGVLIPRQETELLVEKALEFCSARGPDARPRISDIGTGSGAVAIAIARNMPRATVYATDLSRAALVIADANRRRHRVAHQVHLRHGDLFDALTGPVDLLVSNPPYIRSGDIHCLAPEIQWEPSAALDGGAEGLDVIRRLLRQASDYLRPGGRVLVEIAPEQLEAVRNIAQESVPGAEVSFHEDLLRLPRVVAVQLETSPTTGVRE